MLTLQWFVKDTRYNLCSPKMSVKERVINKQWSNNYFLTINRFKQFVVSWWAYCLHIIVFSDGGHLVFQMQKYRHNAKLNLLKTTPYMFGSNSSIVCEFLNNIPFSILSLTMHHSYQFSYSPVVYVREDDQNGWWRWTQNDKEHILFL